MGTGSWAGGEGRWRRSRAPALRRGRRLSGRSLRRSRAVTAETFCLLTSKVVPTASAAFEAAPRNTLPPGGPRPPPAAGLGARPEHLLLPRGSARPRGGSPSVHKGVLFSGQVSLAPDGDSQATDMGTEFTARKPTLQGKRGAAQRINSLFETARRGKKSNFPLSLEVRLDPDNAHLFPRANHIEAVTKAGKTPLRGTRGPFWVIHGTHTPARPPHTRACPKLVFRFEILVHSGRKCLESA